MQKIKVSVAHFARTVEKYGTSAAAARFGISMRTARRIIATVRVHGGSVAIHRGRPTQQPKPRLQRERIKFTSAEEDSAFRRLRRTPFPYPPMLEHEQIAVEFARLVHYKSFLKHNTIKLKSTIGLPICYPFFPNRYDARAGGRSAVEAWHDRDALRAAIRLQLRYGDPTEAHRVLRAITLRCRTPTIFRPAVAKFIYERYAAPGQLVWDPCAGYGGRLLGAAAAGVHYIATDVEATTVNGNLALAAAIASEVHVICCPAEEFKPPRDVALVFTSPPYFNREQYSNSDQQSWKRYASLDTWVEGFLQPIIAHAKVCLRSNGRLVLNIADIQQRNKTVLPLVTKTIETATESGFRHVETLQMPIGSINRISASEPILVFQK